MLRLLVVLLVITGCAGFNEAYRDRVGWEIGGQPPKVTFACERPLRHSEARVSGEGTIAITVEREPDPDMVEAGELSGSWMAWVAGRDRIPVLVNGPLPNEVLSRDVEAELRRRLFTVDGETAAKNLTLRVGMTVFGTERVPARWYELTMNLRAVVAFRAELRRGDETLWGQDFAAEEQARHGYDLTSYRMKLLSEAYCRCLEQFAEALDDPEFDRALRSEPPGA